MSGEYSSATILFHVLSKAKLVDICTSDSTPEFIGMIFHIVENQIISKFANYVFEDEAMMPLLLLSYI